MLKDHLTGPVWILWIVFGVIAALSAFLLTGRGANLIAGFNTASKEEKEQFDSKKLSRLVGIWMAVIALFVLAMALFSESLSVVFVYVFMCVTVIGSVVMVVLANTVCRKRR
ncbi:MAG: DUF3784 domain-containing protein [Clostridia bacterium]|nr:DUF3784 domain-containing protein [Clostridia bacterium]